jgi:hypothetical protein
LSQKNAASPKHEGIKHPEQVVRFIHQYHACTALSVE